MGLTPPKQYYCNKIPMALIKNPLLLQVRLGYAELALKNSIDLQLQMLSLVEKEFQHPILLNF